MRDTKVRDIMTPTVVVAREDTRFKDLVRLMAENRVSAVPVVREDGTLAGLVSEADVLSTEEYGPSRNVILDWFLGKRRLEQIEQRNEDSRAADMMTHSVITIGPDEDIHQAAQKMLREGVKRLPVVDEEGRVIGIIARRDLIQPYLREDEDIRKEILDDIVTRVMWLEPDVFRVTVRKGVVEIRGVVETEGTKDILLDLIRRVDGVVGVQDRVGFRTSQLDPGPLPEPRYGLTQGQVR